MLSITKPIKPVLSAGFVNTGEGFAERIAGNYSLMRTAMFPEDLLHLVTQPPEIFVAGGDGGSLFAQTNIENTQIQKVNVISNLVNRILIAADGNLTYQDNTYITSVLNKIGIHDVKRFMEQVFHITQETRETRSLLRTYEDNRTQLVNLVNEYKTSVDESRQEAKTEVSEVQNQVLHLHESVNNRWQTGTDVQVLQNFYEAGRDAAAVSENIYHLSEQSGFYEQLRINSLRSEVRGEFVPMLYHRTNIYEGNDIFETDYTDNRIDGRINSAVLLNMVSNLYRSIEEKTLRRTDQWYHVGGTFYRAGDVTLRRMQSNTAYLQTLYERDQLTQQNVSSVVREQEVINALIDQSKELTQNISLQQSAGDVFQEADMSLHVTQGDEILQEESREGDVTVSNLEQTVEQATVISNRIEALRKQEESEGRPREAGDVYSQTDLVQNITENVQENLEQTDARNTLEQQLYQINLKNEQRQREYVQNLQNLMEEFRSEPVAQHTPEEIRQQSILALEHPETFISQYREEAAVEETREQEFARRAEELLPKETRVVFDIVREYLEHPENRTPDSPVFVNNAAMLYYDTMRQTENTERVLEEGKTFVQEQRDRIQTLYESAPRPAEQESGSLAALDGMILHPRTEGEGGPGTAEEIPEELKQFLRTELNEVVSERVVREREQTERIIEAEARSAVQSEQAREPMTAMRFVHKSNRSTVDEQTIENLREQINRVEENTKKTTETISNVDTTEHKVINQNNTTYVNERANEDKIVSIVGQSLRSQIDDISGRVYAKIERQLESERRRRGL